MEGKVRYVGKSLLLEIGAERKERILVISDLHLGYEGSMRKSGFFVPSGIYYETIKDMELIFKNILSEGKKVDKIIILGDLKHEIGAILKEEWREVLDFIDFLISKKVREIVIVKGNHDVMIHFLLKHKRVKIVDYLVIDDFAFLHGDRDFREIYDKKVKVWVLGHLHPSIILKDRVGVKEEKYKCFLIGKYKNKKIVILPSFFVMIEGSDVRDNNDMVWKFRFKNFAVKVVGEKLKVLDFGRLKNIKN